MGPRCRPHKTRFVRFLALFCTTDIWLLDSNYISATLLTMRDAAGGWVPDVSLTKREAFDFLDCFLPAICGYSTLTFHPGAMLTLRDAAG